jgi:hypothetical protein
MNLTLLSLLLLPGAEPKTTPKFPVDKETTYATGPIDKDGYIDYEAALNERLRKNTTPDKNGAVLLWKALGPKPEGDGRMPAEFFKQLGIAEPELKKGDYFVNLGRFMLDHLKLQQNEVKELFDQQSRATRRPWTTLEYPHMAVWLLTNEKQLDLVVEATKRPEYFNPLVSRTADGKRGLLVGALLPLPQKCRELATALTARAMFRLSAGKEDEAWQDLLACHRLAHMVSRGSSLIELLVGVAIDSIASNASLVYLERAKLTSKQIRERLKDLQSLPPLTTVADKIDLGERFMCLDCLQSLRQGGFNLLAGVIDAPKNLDRDAARRIMDKIDWAPTYRTANRWYDRLAAALRVADRVEREKRLDQIDVDLKALKVDSESFQEIMAKLDKAGAEPDKRVGKAIGDMLICLLMPAVRKVQGASDRAKQIRNNLHVAFALAAYRVDKKRYPEKLTDLAPIYLATMPGDLFTGRPLTYRVAENGYLFYSFGANGKDDEGRWFDDVPKGDDIRVRMPMPVVLPRE